VKYSGTSDIILFVTELIMYAYRHEPVKHLDCWFEPPLIYACTRSRTVACMWVALHTREVPSSNIGPEAVHPSRDFSCFLFPADKCRGSVVNEATIASVRCQLTVYSIM
jgi:hypothetical protein